MAVGYLVGRVLWIADFGQCFHVCVPHACMDAAEAALADAGARADSLVFER